MGVDTVSYNNGSVRVVFFPPGHTPKNSVTPNDGTVNGCPYGELNQWACFYADVDFGGRMLEFQDCGYEQYFSNYGFQDETSSWVNTKSVDVSVFDYSGYQLWMESPNSKSSWVGSAANDRAWSLYIYCS